MRQRIIYLNGPSSAGKSSIARELQAKLNQPFLHLGIDHLIAWMPAHLNDWENGSRAEGFSFLASRDAGGHPLRELHIGSYGERIAATFAPLAGFLIDQGHNLIIDDVAIRGTEEAAWKELFARVPNLKVGVTASLADLEAREAARGDRAPGSARAQLAKITFDETYALVVDTSALSTPACAAEILSRAEL